MKVLLFLSISLLLVSILPSISSKTASCKITPDPTYNISGRVEFYQHTENDEIFVDAEILGLPPNTRHGFHVHEFGNIAGGCASTGAHYNPHNVDHGGPKDPIRHIGDMGNLIADKNGTAIFYHQETNMSLYGENSIIGRACMVHELEDDLGKGDNASSKVTGNAGKRMGCGIINDAEIENDDVNPWIWPLVLGVTGLGVLYYYFIFRRKRMLGKYQSFENDK